MAILGKVRKVCVCVCECFECHDALHVGNFLVSCIPIGSSPIHSPVTGNHTKWPGGNFFSNIILI